MEVIKLKKKIKKIWYDLQHTSYHRRCDLLWTGCQGLYWRKEERNHPVMDTFLMKKELLIVPELQGCCNRGEIKNADFFTKSLYRE